MTFLREDIRENAPTSPEALLQAYHREATPIISLLRREMNRVSGDLTFADADYSVLLTDRAVVVDDSVPVTITLPAAASMSEQRVLVKKAGTSVDVVTLSAQTGETIDGSLTVALSTTYGWLEVLSDGAEWLKVAEG